MKKLLYLFPAALLLGLVSCQQFDADVTPASDPAARFIKLDYLVTQHAWQPVFFWSAGEDNTSMLKEFSFRFNADHTFIAMGSQLKLRGEWESAMEADGAFLKMVVRSGPEDYSMLSRRWTIAPDFFQNETMMKLSDIMPSKKESYVLHFEAL